MQLKNLYKFLIKLVYFIVLMVILDVLIGYFLKKSFFAQKDSRFAKTTYIINDLKSDVVIFGDSRAEHHYNPKIIEDSLNMTCFNAGSDGQGIFYYKALQNCILKRYTPKIFILDFDYKKLYYLSSYYDRLSYLAPYYDEFEEIKPIVELKGKFEKYKLLSNLYTYNSSLLITLRSYIKPKEYKDGYNPLVETMSGPNHKFFDQNEVYRIRRTEFDTTAIAYYKQFLIDAKNAGVKVYVFVSPKYGNLTAVEESMHLLKKITEETGTEFFDYTTRLGDISSDYKFFRDETHMNFIGANLYTNEVQRIIKSDLNGTLIYAQGTIEP